MVADGRRQVTADAQLLAMEAEGRHLVTVAGTRLQVATAEEDLHTVAAGRRTVADLPTVEAVADMGGNSMPGFSPAQ
jgi:hypothetical protein